MGTDCNDQDLELIQEIPVYLTRPQNTEYFLARYPGQVHRNITTLSNASKIKLKPKQKNFEIEIPLYEANSNLISSANCNEAKLNHTYRNDNTQKLEGTLQTKNTNQQLFIGQIAYEEREVEDGAEVSDVDADEDDGESINSSTAPPSTEVQAHGDDKSATVTEPLITTTASKKNSTKKQKPQKPPQEDLLTLHLTPINGGTIFFRPKQTIFDILKEEEKLENKKKKEEEAREKLITGNGLVPGADDSTDDESDVIGAKNKYKSVSIQMKFDRTKTSHKAGSEENQAFKKDDIKKWKEYLSEKDNEDYVSNIALTLADTVKSSEIRDNEMMCHSQLDILTEHQSSEDYWSRKDIEVGILANGSGAGPGSANSNSLSQSQEVQDDTSKMSVLDLFSKRAFLKEQIISLARLKTFEKEFNRQFSKKDVDSYCYKLTGSVEDKMKNLLTIKSCYCFWGQSGGLKKCLEMVRDMALLVLINHQQIKETLYFQKFQTSFTQLYKEIQNKAKPIKETQVNRYIRDIFREFHLKRSSLEGSTVWKLDENIYRGLEFDKSCLLILKSNWPDWLSLKFE